MRANPALAKSMKDCDAFCNRAMAEMGDINIYEIYADICLSRTAPAARLLAALQPQGAALRVPSSMHARRLYHSACMRWQCHSMLRVAH